MKIRIPLLEWFQGNEEDRARDTRGLLKAGESDPVFLEQFKALRSKLEYKMDTLGWKVIGVTSSIAGEGKTLTCAKVAASMASTKRKNVLLVDADIRKADLTKGLRISLHPGLTEFLLGTSSLKDIVRDSGVPGLKVVPSGTSIPTPGELLAGERFRTFIGETRNFFDVVLLDTPPILPVADTLSMREQLDGFIFLYRTGLTPLSMFQQATEEIGEKKILGVVLNGVAPKSDRYYTQYYGHYYISSKNKGSSG